MDALEILENAEINEFGQIILSAQEYADIVRELKDKIEEQKGE